jgi:chromosome segregation ATPase
MSTASTRGAANNRKRQLDQPKTQLPSFASDQQRDVRSKLSDFTRMMDDIVAENEEAKQELIAAKEQLDETLVQLRIAKERNQIAGEDHSKILRRNREEHEALVRDLTKKHETTVKDLNQEKEELQRRIDASSNDTAELTELRNVVASVRMQFKDYITLETAGASLLTSTGQVACARGVSPTPTHILYTYTGHELRGHRKPMA